jgi:hypothetical protein
VSPQDLKISSAYYRVTYADTALTIPGVKPMVYVGTNISDDDDPKDAIYYFQDTVSHSWRGPVTDTGHRSTHPEIEAAVFPHSESDVQHEVFTLAEVITKLVASRKRAESEKR